MDLYSVVAATHLDAPSCRGANADRDFAVEPLLPHLVRLAIGLALLFGAFLALAHAGA